MFALKTAEEILLEIRGIDESVKNARISGIEIIKKEKRIKYSFICENVVGEEVQKKAWRLLRDETPKIFEKVNVYFSKIVSNDELINNEIVKYITENYPSVSIFLKNTDVRSTVMGDLVKYVIRLTEDNADYLSKSGAISKLNAYLAKKFCSDFAGGTEIKEPEERISLLSEEVYSSQLQKIEHRTIKVTDVIPIDDPFMEDTAVYIEDATSGDIVICGKITDIAERETKNGKPFFILHLDDTTGRTSGVYFTRKNTYAKIKELKVDDEIIVHGRVGEYNGRKSVTFDKINRCTFPKDFVKKDKFKKSAPQNYSLIFPSETSTVKIKSVFDAEDLLPKELTETDYVVFDLETTGLELMSNGITEIGAVKIRDGKLFEQFTTLIKPDYPITQEIVKITGITEEMVKDAPKISAVIPDFMKFIENSVLVAHNAEFDVKFIKRFAGAEDYEVKNKVLDTLEMSRACLPSLRRNDLHTLADYFNISFRHHRALSDAYATAEIFIELMKIKYGAKA